MSKMVGPGSKYTDEQRIEAAIQYAATGSLAKVEQLTGIPDSTVSDWRKQEWWDEAVGKVRSEKEAEHRAKYSQIVDKAQAVTLAKLDDSSAAQANLIACQATDKVRLADNMPTSIRGDSSSMKELAAEFRRISQDNKNIKNSVVSEQDSTKPGEC